VYAAGFEPECTSANDIGPIFQGSTILRVLYSLSLGIADLWNSAPVP